jgi:D-alanine-D-alanine ligase
MHKDVLTTTDRQLYMIIGPAALVVKHFFSRAGRVVDSPRMAAPAPLKIGILYDAWHEGQEEERAAPSAGRRSKTDREEIFEALAKHGHKPEYHCLDGRIRSLKALAGADFDLIFNLTESYGGDDTKDINIAAYLDLLGLPYTGSGPSGLHLAQDKAVAKRLFQSHGIRTPRFATADRGRPEGLDDLNFPVIVKPKREDGSIGIEFNAVVGSTKQALERIDALRADLGSPVLIEEYIEGRELYAAVLGNDPPELLPVVELDLSDLPPGTPHIAGTEVKWERGTAAYRRTKLRIPSDLPQATLAEIEETALAAFRALEIRDYGRVDLRLAEDGTIYTLEVNPNPWLHSTAEFATAARASGRDLARLVEEIVALAITRYRGGTLPVHSS